jgi:hypothetical protein
VRRSPLLHAGRLEPGEGSSNRRRRCMPDVTNQLIPLLWGFAGQELPVNAGRRKPGYITLLWGLGGADAQRTPRTRRFLYSDRRHPMQAERWRNYQLHASIISLLNTRSDTNHVGEDQMYRCKLCAPKASRGWLHCCVEFSTYTCAWYCLLCYACIAYIHEWVKKNLTQ